MLLTRRTSPKLLPPTRPNSRTPIHHPRNNKLLRRRTLLVRSLRLLDVHQNAKGNQMNTECECNYCKCGDEPYDPELTFEMRLDIAEAALQAVRAHLWQLDQKLNNLIEWNKRLDISVNIERHRNDNTR
jgi:hypothetical protein